MVLLRRKFTSILLLFFFTVVLLHPLMPFVKYYLAQNNQTEISLVNNEYCGCIENSSSSYAKVENNGEGYLKALIKRVCEQKKKEKPAIPLIQLPIFVRDLSSISSQIYICPKQNFNNKISTFIILPDINTYITDIFHPPVSKV